MSMRPEEFPSSQWKEAVSYLFDFFDIFADDFVD